MSEEIKNGLVIDEEGTKRWYKNDQLHRDNDLPAIEYENGYKEWHINGQELSEEKFNHYVEIKILNEQLHQNLKVKNQNIKLPKL